MDQCISLSLSDIKKNESMLRAACFFRSNTCNAFFFKQALMSPTLADVHMLIGLNIAGQINTLCLLRKPTSKLESVRTGGWSHYINTFKTDKKAMTHREHTAFLNMWFDRYVFCGHAYAPTSNYLALAEKIAVNSKIPFGKLLLGALYNFLNRVSQHVMKSEVVPTIIGPWWLL